VIEELGRQKGKAVREKWTSWQRIEKVSANGPRTPTPGGSRGQEKNKKYIARLVKLAVLLLHCYSFILLTSHHPHIYFYINNCKVETSHSTLA
jgi:hypothetical protein